MNERMIKITILPINRQSPKVRIGTVTHKTFLADTDSYGRAFFQKNWDGIKMLHLRSSGFSYPGRIDSVANDFPVWNVTPAEIEEIVIRER